jgi:hypothetical protein
MSEVDPLRSTLELYQIVDKLTCAKPDLIDVTLPIPDFGSFAAKYITQLKSYFKSLDSGSPDLPSLTTKCRTNLSA